MLIIKYYFFIIFISFSFSQFILPQKSFYKLLKWEEINSRNIIISKVGPEYLSGFKINNNLFPSKNYSFKNNIFNWGILPELSLGKNDFPRYKLYGNVVIQLNNQLLIQNDFEFDNMGQNDTHFQGVERGFKNGWVGYLQHSTLTYKYSTGLISLGRGNPFYYSLNEDLLLNANFPPSEFIRFKHSIDWFEYDWSIILLNELGSFNRFLTFHRYGINNNIWRVGFSEATLVAYDIMNSKHVGYLMPSALFLETESNRGNNANLMWLIDIMYKRAEWTLYGEFLIDDFSLDGRSSNQIASLIGFGKKINQLLINFEIVNINKWTGNHCDPLKHWLEQNTPIGHSIGSNAHQILLDSYYIYNDKLSFELSFSYIKHGIGDAINRLSDWPEGLTCDLNFDNFETSKSKMFSKSYISGTIFYFISKNISIQFNLDKLNSNLDYNLIVNYGLNSDLKN